MKSFFDFGIDVGASARGEVRAICPSCSAGRRKSKVKCLSVNVSEGIWYCFHCGHSGGLGRDAFSLDRMQIERLRTQAEAERQGRYAANKPKVAALWDLGAAVQTDDPVCRYLAGRRIRLDLFPADLRYTSRLPYFDDERRHLGDWPAMLAAVRDDAGNLIAVHRTWLQPDGRKAPVDPCRKLSMACGPVTGSAIRLAPVRDKCLGIAEGIETALAASLGAQVPVWSAISAFGLQSFRWPAGLRKLLVFGDNDANNVGQGAAEKLADRARRAGIAPCVLVPSNAGADWADVWADCAEVAA